MIPIHQSIHIRLQLHHKSDGQPELEREATVQLCGVNCNGDTGKMASCLEDLREFPHTPGCNNALIGNMCYKVASTSA